MCVLMIDDSVWSRYLSRRLKQRPARPNSANPHRPPNTAASVHACVCVCGDVCDCSTTLYMLMSLSICFGVCFCVCVHTVVCGCLFFQRFFVRKWKAAALVHTWTHRLAPDRRCISSQGCWGPWGWREGLNEGEENKGGTDNGSDWHVRAVLFCYQLLKVCQRPDCTLEPLSGPRYGRRGGKFLKMSSKIW